MKTDSVSFAQKSSLVDWRWIGLRLFNGGMAFIILLFALPLAALTALSVRIFLGRPILFKQTRTGLRGRPFTIYKFRTMSELDGQPAPSSGGASAIIPSATTKVGRFLRAFSLDELPQLFNVIKGDMNLVGPRPLLARYLSFYSPLERSRLNVPPGLTGWAQIHGRNNLSWEDKLKLDVWYVNHRSLGLDFKILFKTAAMFLKVQQLDKTAKPPLHAFDHGKRVTRHLFPSWPVYPSDEIEAVVNVLESGKVNYWTGSVCKQFEQEFARYVGSQYAVSLANGSIALELALRALGIGAGDEVIVPARTFFATAGSVALCGATPVFADVDAKSQLVTTQTITPLITSRTKAIIVVHLAGWPCDMKSIMTLAKTQHLKVIEDCAQAHGAYYYRRSVGSYGDVGVFSFCQDKIMSTGGEGGMLVTSDKAIWSRVWSYKDHGKDYKLAHAPVEAENKNTFRWLHTTVGSNYRLTEMQAAIGRVQLNKLDKWVKRRRQWATIYTKRFAGSKLLTTYAPDNPMVYHAYYKFYVFINTEKLKSTWNRDKLLAALASENIPCGSGICPEVYREKAFASLKQALPLPVASRLGEITLMLPLHPTLREADIHFIAERVLAIVNEAARL